MNLTIVPTLAGSIWAEAWLIVTVKGITGGATKLVGTLTLATPIGEVTDNTPVAGPVVELAGII